MEHSANARPSFVVAVGYALDDVLAAWRTKILAYLIGNILVATVSLFLALAYHRNRANAQDMERLAMTDPLTGLRVTTRMVSICHSRRVPCSIETRPRRSP
jgi:hypothetical protein